MKKAIKTYSKVEKKVYEKKKMKSQKGDKSRTKIFRNA